MKVFAQYITPVTDVNDVVTALASAIAGSFGYVSPVGESATLADAFGAALAGGAAVPNLDRQGAPKAYMQYIIFNKNMTMAQHGYSMVTDEAMANWQKLELEVPVEENGYIYIYVANESMSDVNVYFDDLEVQLIDAPVTNASDYYPFGLAMAGRSYSSERYRFGYQGQFAEKDEETGWNSFELRMYAPVIGRWMNTDPAGQYFSSYLSMSNNPVISIDPDGSYSKFGAAWRSFFHPGSEVIPVGESGKEYAVLFKGYQNIGGEKMMVYNSFVEGRIVFGDPFEGVGFEIGGGFSFTQGVQSLNDAGVSGTTLNFGSITLLEFYPKIYYEYPKGFSATWGFYMAGLDDKVRFTQGASYEGVIDVKGGLAYEADAASPKLKLTSSYFGVGIPFYEAKYQHDHIHGGGIFKHGLQEDWSSSFKTGLGIAFGAKAGFNIQATQRID